MIRQYKGVPILIKAFSQLPAAIANNSHLVIAGEDWGDDPELYPALNNSPYRERILFQPGFIPDELVPVYFAAADVVVLPYLRTCGSGVASIAVAQGKPIITSDLATMREYLAEYKETGFCQAGDAASLRDMLARAYRQWQENRWPQQSNQPGLTWRDITNKYGQIIRDLLS
jgi:glycosyltransferase involved in cell wall biosynthesis